MFARDPKHEDPPLSRTCFGWFGPPWTRSRGSHTSEPPAKNWVLISRVSSFNVKILSAKVCTRIISPALSTRSWRHSWHEAYLTAQRSADGGAKHRTKTESWVPKTGSSTANIRWTTALTYAPIFLLLFFLGVSTTFGHRLVRILQQMADGKDGQKAGVLSPAVAAFFSGFVAYHSFSCLSQTNNAHRHNILSEFSFSSTTLILLSHAWAADDSFDLYGSELVRWCQTSRPLVNVSRPYNVDLNSYDHLPAQKLVDLMCSGVVGWSASFALISTWNRIFRLWCGSNVLMSTHHSRWDVLSKEIDTFWCVYILMT